MTIGRLGRAAIIPIVLVFSADEGEGQNTAWVPSVKPAGQSVMPVFEGWYRNDDGTFTLQFGYFSRGSEGTVHVPLSPDNRLEPSVYDGRQPTRFLPQPQDRGPGRGIRHWGVFTVDVPADFGNREVTWTLRSGGGSVSVPGHIGNELYELEVPGAVGDRPPALQFDSTGPVGRGPSGLETGGLHSRAGTSLDLYVHVTDSGALGSPVTLRWLEYQGPGSVTFPEGRVSTVAGVGIASTKVILSEPGEYIIWVLATNASTEFDRYCCWTNGYVRITATE